MAELNVVTAAFEGSRRSIRTAPIWQWDYGQILRITGLDLPVAFQVHFSNEPAGGTSTTMIGTTAAGVSDVDIPNTLLETGENVYAFIYLHQGENDGETEYMITIPVNDRSEPDEEEPTPEQASAIDQAIAALQSAVASTQASAEAAEDSAEAAAGSAASAGGSVKDAEAWAVGTKDGTPVEETDPQYHNNSKYYAGRANDSATAAAGSAGDASDSATAAAGSARDASDSAAAAEGSADEAELYAERAEQAATSAGYMFFEIDEEGHLIYTRTDQVTADFDIDANGHLVMEG